MFARVAHRAARTPISLLRSVTVYEVTILSSLRLGSTCSVRMVSKCRGATGFHIAHHVYAASGARPPVAIPDD